MRKGLVISQQAFDSLVKENMEDLGMAADEALEDAIQTLTLQSADLSGIIKRIPGNGDGVGEEEHPVILAINSLKKITGNSDDSASLDEKEMLVVVDEVRSLCLENENAAIAIRNDAVELLILVCARLSHNSSGGAALVSSMRTLALVIRDLQSTEAFRHIGGPKVVIDILRRSGEDLELLDSCFTVISAAATGNEVVKESFIELKVGDLLLQTMKKHPRGMRSLYDSIHVLLTQDDNRVLASQTFGYARRFAEIGVVDALVDTLCEGINSMCLTSACVALKALAVNDEICKSVSGKGGIDAILKCIDDSAKLNNKEVAKTCCSLLSKLAGSDANKSSIVQKAGLERLVKLLSTFSEDPSVLQEVMSIISVLSLRSPENAARAIEAGAGDFVIQAMQKFPSAYQLQRQACFMVRNLVVRNPEIRAILLSSGIEKIIRRAKASHEGCKDAATDALRDLGVDNYMLK